jgi:hypothetical protein
LFESTALRERNHDEQPNHGWNSLDEFHGCHLAARFDDFSATATHKVQRTEDFRQTQLLKVAVENHNVSGHDTEDVSFLFEMGSEFGASIRDRTGLSGLENQHVADYVLLAWSNHR